jgi:hypothetical protein
MLSIAVVLPYEAGVALSLPLAERDDAAPMEHQLSKEPDKTFRSLDKFFRPDHAPIQMAGEGRSGGCSWKALPGVMALSHHIYPSQHGRAVVKRRSAKINSNGARGNAVIRPPPDLGWQPAPEDFFEPADWLELNQAYMVLAYNNSVAFDLPDGGPGAALVRPRQMPPAAPTGTDWWGGAHPATQRVVCQLGRTWGDDRHHKRRFYSRTGRADSSARGRRKAARLPRR